MGKFSDALLFGITIRESANDGSDFTNPAADYRRLFLGEDGLLHLRDSAGTITDIGGASGAVATDAIWDAAGDLVQGTGANTAAKLSAGTSGKVLTSNGAAAALTWETPSGSSGGCATASTQGTGSADYTSSSATYVDVDGTNLAITPTLAQSGDILRVEAVFSFYTSSGTANSAATFSIAGTDVGDTLGLGFVGDGTAKPHTLVYYYTMPSGTQPAIKLRYKSAGTVAMYNRTAVVRPRMSVTNMSRGGTL